MEIMPMNPPAVDQSASQPAAAPKVNFREAFKQQKLAAKTHTVYNHGVKEYDQLTEQLKSLGQEPQHKIEKLPEIELNPDMSVAKAMESLKDYNKEGKGKVEDLSRKIIRTENQIKEENKVRQYADRLWKDSDASVEEADKPRIIFRASYRTTRIDSLPRRIHVQLNPFLCLALGWHFGGSFALGLAAAVAAQLYNDSAK
jgi:hypothetical protein